MFYTFSKVPVISISNAQRRPVPQANWVRTIHHGLPENLLTPQPTKPSYLAVLGRIAPEKGVDRAIKIATRCGMPLKIAAKVDRADQDYYDELIRPMIENNPLVDYIGEISDHEKSDFLSGAIGLLVPIDWPEPFGLVMIEAMACGTPVIAYNRGSVAEIIDDGLTGFIVEDEMSAVAAVDRLSQLDRPNPQGVREALHRAPHGARLSRGLSQPDGGRRTAHQAGQQRGVRECRRIPGWSRKHRTRIRKFRGQSNARFEVRVCVAAGMTLCLTHRRALRLDDFEHPRKFVHQHHQFAEPQRIAGELDLAAADRVLERRQFGDDLVERAARQREAGVGI